MDGNSNCTLILCGKSPAENEIAIALKSSNALKLPESTELSILLQSEFEKPVKEDAFGVDTFMSLLSTSRFGRFLLWSPRLPSTHDVVSNNFCELPVGAVCVADVQYKGRGRLKNVWESPEGCLLFSFTLQMEDGRVVPLIQYVVSLAVTEAIKGFQSLEELYYRTWLHSGLRVIVQEKTEDQVVENVVTIQGLTSSGYLLAIGDDNQMCELHPDGYRFDFFKGLVRRKMD